VAGVRADGHEAVYPQVGELRDLADEFFYLFRVDSVLAGCPGGIDLYVHGEGPVGVAFLKQAALEPVEALG
ncbi:hypothetical protein OJ604_11215, partial [Streptococcus anginosus]|nr:hypothetical protein [Streptococcus anginosus]